MLFELRCRLDQHPQVDFERPHLVARHGEMRAADSRRVDMRPEHEFRLDLGLDHHRLAAVGCAAEPEIVVEGIEPGLEPRREANETLTAQPQLDLDRQPCPVVGHCCRRAQHHRRCDDRPRFAELNWPRIPTVERKLPVANRRDAGIPPRAQLAQPPRQPLVPPLVKTLERTLHGSLLLPRVSFIRD